MGTNTDVKLINICMLGQVGVGKSSITLQYTQSHFPTDFNPNVEDMYSKETMIGGQKYKINVLDTANQDTYSPLRDLQFKEADGFMIVFRLDSQESFVEASDAFRHIMRVKGKLPPIILIGNQSDSHIYNRQITLVEAESLASDLGLLKYFEVSAKNNINVNESFEYLCESILTTKESSNCITTTNSASNSTHQQKQAHEISRTANQTNNRNLNQAKNNGFTVSNNFEAVSVSSHQPRADLSVEAQRSRQKSTRNKGLKENSSSSSCCIIA